jgi:plasminogen activator
MEIRAVHNFKTLLLATTFVVATSTQCLAAGPVAVAPAQNSSGGIVVESHPEKPVDFTLRVGTGYLTGESNEMVYWPDVNNHKASELTWKIDNLFMIGFGASLRTGKWFTVNFDGWFKITDGDGTMDDYDWRQPGGPWTDWSHHEDTDVTDGSMIDINGEVSFLRTSVVTLNGILGYKRDNFGWVSRGGEYIYSVNGFRDADGSFNDNALAISYEQTLEVPYFGVGIKADFGKSKLDVRTIFSPFVKGEAVDHHHMRNLVTYDDFSDGDIIGVDVAGSYMFSDNFSMEVGLSFQSYDTMQGDSEWHYNDVGQVVFVNDGAGMDQESAMMSVSFLYTF